MSRVRHRRMQRRLRKLWELGEAKRRRKRREWEATSAQRRSEWAA